MNSNSDFSLIEASSVPASFFHSDVNPHLPDVIPLGTTYKKIKKISFSSNPKTNFLGDRIRLTYVETKMNKWRFRKRRSIT